MTTAADSPYRQSTLDSANQAEGIFDLYGEGPSGIRDSWDPSRVGLALGSPAGDIIPIPGNHDKVIDLNDEEVSRYVNDRQQGDNGTFRPSNGDRNGIVEKGPAGRPHRLSDIPLRPENDRMEELDEEEVDAPATQQPWDGPMATLSNRISSSSITSPDDLGPPVRTPNRKSISNGSFEHGSNSNIRRSSSSRRKAVPTPFLTVTPEMTPSKNGQIPSHLYNGNGMIGGNGGDDSFNTSLVTNSTATTPRTDRLTPRLSDATSIGIRRVDTTNGSFSQASIGSSQYPGEEDDAFHVRSTYARLDVNGVAGDGYDAGVERTRGGPSVGKRMTMMEAEKGGEVGDDERTFLASLDRYGFVNEPLRNRSETRVALIPAGPFSKIPKLPSTSPLAGKPAAQPNGPIAGHSGNPPSPRAPQTPRLGDMDDQRHRQKEQERVGKWMKMMGVRKKEGGNAIEWDWREEGLTKLRRRVYKGIPDRWRMAAWWTLGESAPSDIKGKGKRLADDLLSDYRQSIDLPSTFDVQIDLDVPRTISGHTLFVTRYGAGQRSLFHVLHCFSMYCESCGYCQGMGPIAATLLCYYDPERVFALLIRLHDSYGMHDIFGPGFPGLLEAFYVQERLMEWLMPDLYQAFQRNMISSSAWGTKWYITLFVNTVPFSQQLRLWDALWLDGRDVIVMTAIAILWAFRDLLSSPNANFESILSLLSSYFVAEDEDKLMRWIKRMLHAQGMKRKMDDWREEWHDLVRTGKDKDALL